MVNDLEIEGSSQAGPLQRSSEFLEGMPVCRCVHELLTGVLFFQGAESYKKLGGQNDMGTTWKAIHLPGVHQEIQEETFRNLLP